MYHQMEIIYKRINSGKPRSENKLHEQMAQTLLTFIPIVLPLLFQSMFIESGEVP